MGPLGGGHLDQAAYLETEAIEAGAFGGVVIAFISGVLQGSSNPAAPQEQGASGGGRAGQKHLISATN